MGEQGKVDIGGAISCRVQLGKVNKFSFVRFNTKTWVDEPFFALCIRWVKIAVNSVIGHATCKDEAIINIHGEAGVRPVSHFEQEGEDVDDGENWRDRRTYHDRDRVRDKLVEVEFDWAV
jgi:hypothetical protein